MKKKLQLYLWVIFLSYFQTMAQLSNVPGTNGIKTFVNPILPGDHPDQTLLRVGNDFYSTGSNFHFTPYLPILHSTDLMHWEVIARVIPPSSAIPSNDSPTNGTWGGALAFFNNFYWVFFSNNAGGGQYFCKATNLAGPWSSPVKVNGVYGYDNSIFVDDDGTPYMLMKNGQDNNGIQRLGMDGQPSGAALNLNWVNANGHPYSWAEGPVMCKRNGRYYYFVAGNVTGGQYVLSSATLTANESSWTRHGNFWQTATSPGGFTGPNHITQPIKLDDGTWWCLSHAYDGSEWGGQGRQSHLHQVLWDANGVPKGVPVNINPVAGPNLPNNRIAYEFIKSDYFNTSSLSLNWHFFNKTMAASSRYSQSERPGYLRLKPGTATTHVLQKDKGKYYSLTTKVELNATANGQEAGLRLTSGNDLLFYNLYSGYNNGKKIGVSFNGVRTEIANTIGNTIWLRVERSLHQLASYYSADGVTWTSLTSTDVSSLDKSQADYNQWVGTSVGLYASNSTADFDLFSHRYGFAPIRAEGRNNWFGVTFSNKTPGRTVTNSTSGDWLMLAGVDLGIAGTTATGISVNVASAISTASLEVWIDNIGGDGTKLTTIAIPNTGGTDIWKTVTAAVQASGQHDVYLRFIGTTNAFFVNTIQFTSTTIVNTPPAVSITAPINNTSFTAPAAVTISASASDADGTISNVQFYNGTTLLGSDATAPYSFSWTSVAAGTYSITTKATDNSGSVTTSSAVSIVVNPGVNVAPTVNITAPANNTAFTAPAAVTISAAASDADGTVSNVQFYNGTTLLGSDATAPYSFSWTSVAAGTYSITAKATDNSGVVTTSTAVSIVVNPGVNVAPTVSITAPANTAFTAPAAVTITASASDADGSVSNVQFYNGTTLLGSDATAPYSFSWTSVAAGTYSITAKATDNSGAVTTSAAVSISVTAAPVGDITGPDCGSNNTTITFSLNTANRTNATSYNWWYTGSAASTATVTTAPYSVNIQTGANFSAGQICVGVNMNVAPWYKQYCKSLTTCNTTRTTDDMDIETPIQENIENITILTPMGIMVYSGKDPGILQDNSFAAGVYQVYIRYENGRIESKKILNTK